MGVQIFYLWVISSLCRKVYEIFLFKIYLFIFFFAFPVFARQNSVDYLEACPKVVVVSYRMLNRLRKSMIGRKWALMIIDESHNIRCTKKKFEKDEVLCGLLGIK